MEGNTSVERPLACQGDYGDAENESEQDQFQSDPRGAVQQVAETGDAGHARRIPLLGDDSGGCKARPEPVGLKPEASGDRKKFQHCGNRNERGHDRDEPGGSPPDRGDHERNQDRCCQHAQACSGIHCGPFFSPIGRQEVGINIVTGNGQLLLACAPCAAPAGACCVLVCTFPTASAVGYGLASLRDSRQLGAMLRDQNRTERLLPLSRNVRMNSQRINSGVPR